MTLDESNEIPKQVYCLVCGYVYNPVHGDPDQGIEPGTSFDDLPDDWECPEVDDEEIPTKDEE